VTIGCDQHPRTGSPVSGSCNSDDGGERCRHIARSISLYALMMDCSSFICPSGFFRYFFLTMLSDLIRRDVCRIERAERQLEGQTPENGVPAGNN